MGSCGHADESHHHFSLQKWHLQQDTISLWPSHLQQHQSAKSGLEGIFQRELCHVALRTAKQNTLAAVFLAVRTEYPDAHPPSWKNACISQALAGLWCKAYLEWPCAEATVRSCHFHWQVMTQAVCPWLLTAWPQASCCNTHRCALPNPRE